MSQGRYMESLANPGGFAVESDNAMRKVHFLYTGNVLGGFGNRETSRRIVKVSIDVAWVTSDKGLRMTWQGGPPFGF